jgi:hypothetical protein
LTFSLAFGLLLGGLCGPDAQAARGKKSPVPVAPPVVEEEPAPVIPEPTPLFGGPLPVHIGPLPTGLANLSAQGCNACHYQAHDSWAKSTHATGHATPAFTEAVREVGTPACQVCHLPLSAQHVEVVAFDAEDVNRPLHEANPEYQATLHTEGVTCAACHVREGTVVAAAPPTAEAPHPVGWSPELGASSFCGTCHQLTWPGANQPLYDTYGEWQRSPQATAGITCQDCHMGPGVSETGNGANHAFDSARGRALSVLIDIPATTLIRGGDPLVGDIILQNTGAGHAWPTGSPFRGVRLKIFLESVGEDAVTRSAVQTVDFARQLQKAAPFESVGDTRLGAGEERRIPWSGSLKHDAPPGPWFLVVTSTPTVRGAPQGGEVVQRRVAVRVE